MAVRIGKKEDFFQFFLRYKGSEVQRYKDSEDAKVFFFEGTESLRG